MAGQVWNYKLTFQDAVAFGVGIANRVAVAIKRTAIGRRHDLEDFGCQRLFVNGNTLNIRRVAYIYVTQCGPRS